MSENGGEVVKVYFRGMEPELKQRIAEAVASAGTNMNDLLVGAIADRYSFAFEPSKRRSPEVGNSTKVILRMPHELRRLIRSTANDEDRPLGEVILGILREKFTAVAA